MAQPSRKTVKSLELLAEKGPGSNDTGPRTHRVERKKAAQQLDMTPWWRGIDRQTLSSADRSFRAWLGQFTLGISPATVANTTMGWWANLLLAPGKQIGLMEQAAHNAVRLGAYAVQSAFDRDAPLPVVPETADRRFAHDGWKLWPYNVLSQSFLLTQEWWQQATTNISGFDPRSAARMSFSARQRLDAISPSNFPWTNPEIIEATLMSGGANLVHGAQNMFEDLRRQLNNEMPEGTEAFRVGETVAVTPGKVVFRNHLIELIQYSPTTEKVFAEPILIVPAWIMKYYILDLSPGNSLVRYLVEHGHTVFMVSWRNPTSEDYDYGMDEYREQGIVEAVNAISTIMPDRKIHATGYCLGGTLLMITAAVMRRDGDERLGSLSLFTAQGDFSEAGELTLFIDESEIAYLEAMMWDRGYLDTYQMSGAFQILRSNDLIWSRMVREYMLGQSTPMNDLMAWNADATRMPYRMHSEYLRRLFLRNDLASGRYMVDRRPVWFGSKKMLPMFVVGTERDHVAPWRSVYKLHLLAGAEITFVLTSGGHNAGIVSEPGRQNRTYRIATRHPGEVYVDADMWEARTPSQRGSWWLEWQAWLAARSTPGAVPPTMGAPDKGLPPRADAPGTYVLQR